MSGQCGSERWRKRSKQVFERDGYTCRRCGGVFEECDLSAHHILGRCRGGSDAMANLVSLCRTCHENWHFEAYRYITARDNNGCVGCFMTFSRHTFRQRILYHPVPIHEGGLLEPDNTISLCRVCYNKRTKYSGNTPP